MKRIYLFAATVMTAVCVQAQHIAATGDAYMAGKLSVEDLNGTARYVGMGGALDALGADISTIGSNPAGIGLFRKSSVSGTFGVVSQSDGKTFADGSQTNASIDQFGFVFSTRSGEKGFLNFAFNYHKSRNFDYVLSAANALTNGSSQNNQTVIKYLNGEIDRGLPETQLDILYEDNLVFKTEINPETGLEEEKVYNYEYDNYEFDRAHTGYIGEYDFNLSGNINNRVYLGLTVGFNSVHYEGYSEYFESADPNGPHWATKDPNERSVLISDNQKISGYGINVKAGIIFRPIEESPLRIGASVSSPTFYRLTMDNYTTIGTNVDAISASEDFRFNTPWKFALSAGYTVGSQLALGASYEYTDYSTCDMRMIDGHHYNYEWATEYDKSSSDHVMKYQIGKTLKGSSTFKVGAELKPSKNVALRVGYNYVTAVYRKDAVRDQTILSPGVYYASTTDYTNWGDTHRLTAGAGFTFDKLRLDLAYQYQTRKGDFYPFMKYYTAPEYNLTNECSAVQVKDDRHHFMATLTYTF